MSKASDSLFRILTRLLAPRSVSLINEISLLGIPNSSITLHNFRLITLSYADIHQLWIPRMEEGADIEYSRIFYKRHSVEQFLDSSHTPTCPLSCISGRAYRFSTLPVTPRHSRSVQLAREFPHIMLYLRILK